MDNTLSKAKIEAHQPFENGVNYETPEVRKYQLMAESFQVQCDKLKKINESLTYEMRLMANDLRIAEEDKESLRDRFAIAALTGLISQAGRDERANAELAYEVADAMMEARKK